MLNDSFLLLKQGAEGKLYQGKYLGKSVLVKERFVKKYRHPDLDSLLSKDRLKSESKAIVRSKIAGIRTPAIYFVDLERRIIIMEYFDQNITVKEFINTKINDSKSCIQTLGQYIGSVIGKMHQHNIIHGDLTTSNMLLVPKSDNESWLSNPTLDNSELVMIDFGLSHLESSAEDKGVDLYVLERALLSTHSSVKGLFANVLSAYKEHNRKGAREILEKFEEVRARGRKRTMVG